MLSGWLSKLEPVRIARSDEEREAVFRFRYEVYCDEFGRELGMPDHARRRLHDPEDDDPCAQLLYTGSPSEVTGTLRLRHWQPGEVPDAVRRELSMDLFPELGRWCVGEAARLMVRRVSRGKLILASLARAAYETLSGDHGVHLTFCYCSPGLVHPYRKLGYRPFGGSLVRTPDGVMIPLVNVHSDHAYYQRHGSMLASLVRRHFGKDGRAPVPPELYAPLFERATATVQTDPEEVWRTLQDALASPSSPGEGFLTSLSSTARRRLTERGFVLTVEPDVLITREGFGEQEMYLVLDGRFEVTSNGERIGVLGPGELFGEVAFFLATQKRSASVRALDAGRLLVLRAGAVRRLMAADPATASTLLFEIGRVMAERLSERGDGG